MSTLNNSNHTLVPLVKELAQQSISLDANLRAPATKVRNVMDLPSLDAAAVVSIHLAEKILSNFLGDDGTITVMDPDTEKLVTISVKETRGISVAQPKRWPPLTKGPGRDTTDPAAVKFTPPPTSPVSLGAVS